MLKDKNDNGISNERYIELYGYTKEELDDPDWLIQDDTFPDKYPDDYVPDPEKDRLAKIGAKKILKEFGF